MTQNNTQTTPQIDAENNELQTHPTICLEQCRPILVEAGQDPKFLYGTFHVADWGKLFELYGYFNRLICVITGNNDSEPNVKPLLHYCDDKNFARPGLGIFLSAESQSSIESMQRIDSIFLHFCTSALFNGGDPDRQLQLFAETFSDDLLKASADVLREFRENFGGMNIKEPCELRTPTLKLLLCGKVRPGDDMVLPDPIRRTESGQINGIDGDARTFFLGINERKRINVKYDEQRFQATLRPLVLDKTTHQFELETEWITHSKSIVNLISVEP